MKKVGVVCCSNGQKNSFKDDIDKLVEVFNLNGIEAVFSDYIYERESVEAGNNLQRAHALMKFYQDDSISSIYDISGGDIANGVLPYLDYDIIKKNPKRFWGYSDLTTVINAIYTRTGNESVLYQVKNLVWDKSGNQIQNFFGDKLFDFKYDFFRGSHMSGVVVGGNIRCFLKLAGTEYFPDVTGKILFLEALNGGIPQIISHLNQLKQLGVFNKIKGIMLGTFTEIERQNENIIDLFSAHTNDIPIAKTEEIGHSANSKALIIGKYYDF